MSTNKKAQSPQKSEEQTLVTNAPSLPSYVIDQIPASQTVDTFAEEYKYSVKIPSLTSSPLSFFTK